MGALRAGMTEKNNWGGSGLSDKKKMKTTTRRLKKSYLAVVFLPF